MEIALDSQFSIYTGGLGILAGDYIKQLAENGQKSAAVGLLYKTTSVQFVEDDQIKYREEKIIPEAHQLQLVQNAQGQPFIGSIPIEDTAIHYQIWEMAVGSCTVYLLDTAIPQNSPRYQSVTDQLYSGDNTHRLLQEFVLGIGGVQFLEKTQQLPDVLHLNEGHSAFAMLELAHILMKKERKNFASAFKTAQRRIVFTNHTLVGAGHDLFKLHDFSLIFSAYAEQLGVPVSALATPGLSEDIRTFSNTSFLLKTANKVNAVSLYHQQKAAEIWPEANMVSVTNGIYFPRWYSSAKAKIWPLTAEAPESPELFFQAHQEDKHQLLSLVKKHSNKTISSDALICTWARRFVTYKRPEALFWKLDWLEQILQSSPVPIHFIFSGKGHIHDLDAQDAVQRVFEHSISSRFKHFITYMPNYNVDIATQLVQGSDVWLNTPIEGYEACGTSGMKAALNGVLQVSTNDGWMREVDWTNIAWLLDSHHISESIYTTIEQRLLPAYQNRAQWLERMIKTAQVVRDRFSTARMAQEYQELLYH